MRTWKRRLSACCVVAASVLLCASCTSSMVTVGDAGEESAEDFRAPDQDDEAWSDSAVIPDLPVDSAGQPEEVWLQ